MRESSCCANLNGLLRVLASSAIYVGMHDAAAAAAFAAFVPCYNTLETVAVVALAIVVVTR